MMMGSPEDIIVESQTKPCDLPEVSYHLYIIGTVHVAVQLDFTAKIK
jgi:hypothetical protein